MDVVDWLLIALPAVLTAAVAPGAVKDWRSLPSAADTASCDRHRAAMQAIADR